MKISKRINKVKKNVAAAILFFCAIVATPFFTTWYEHWTNEGDLILIEQKPFISGRNYTSRFILTNTSNRPCEDVKIVFRTLLTDHLRLLPHEFHDIKPHVGICEKDWLLSFDRLRPQENISIIIESDVDSMYFANVLEPPTFINDLGELKQNITVEEIQAMQNSNLEYPKLVNATFAEKAIKSIILPRAEVVEYLEQRFDPARITGLCSNHIPAKY